MDKMTIIGKDGKPRYEVTDRVKKIFDCACDEPVPVITADATHIMTLPFLECRACGGRIMPDTTSNSKEKI